tara:strand:- start:669 stop:1331 length:663 start_codon:yes stop_codon:yes gene_type:complete
MRIESKLCHVSDNKAVVIVNGWVDEENLGSALAEGPTVEIAEDRAISRLNKRLRITSNDVKIIKPNHVDNINSKLKIELPKSDKLETFNVKQEPSDWSDELTSIDSEIERLNWSRDDEKNYLEKTFGYNNRNKITSYKDIQSYLNNLKKIDKTNSSEVITSNINNLIEQSDIILRDLSWDIKQGREYLQKNFNVSTRTDLNEKQLQSFVEKLKCIKNQSI